MTNCPWCGEPNRGDAGDYYHEKACHREDVIRRLNELEKRAGLTPSERAELEDELQRELDRASYTGD